MATTKKIYTAIPSQRDSPDSDCEANESPHFEESSLENPKTILRKKISRGIMPISILILTCIIVIQWTLLARIQTKTLEGCFRSKEIPALSYQRNKLRQVGSPSAYNSKNLTEADKAWNTMLTGHGVISFPESYAVEHNMIETLHHSIESPVAEKNRVYVVEAYHALHCLRMLRIHYRAYETDTSWNWNIEHDYHCFDSLRQYIMCNPDYTLWYVTGHRVNGYMQMKMCQDWDALRDWTEEHTGNYFDQYDMEPGVLGDKIWFNYQAGDGLPVGSL